MSRFDPDLPRHLLDARQGLAGHASLWGDDIAIPPRPMRPRVRARQPRPSAVRAAMRDFAWGLVLAWAVVEVLLWFGGA
jgi:hypothetical protein